VSQSDYKQSPPTINTVQETVSQTDYKQSPTDYKQSRETCVSELLKHPSLFCGTGSPVCLLQASRSVLKAWGAACASTTCCHCRQRPLLPLRKRGYHACHGSSGRLGVGVGTSLARRQVLPSRALAAPPYMLGLGLHSRPLHLLAAWRAYQQAMRRQL
jgi:hypothetical protein